MRRRGARTMTAAAALARHELRLLASLLLWAGRRRHGVAGGRAFGYARGQGAMAFGLLFVCAVETVGVSVLLRDWPAAHHVLLVLDLYTLLVVLGLHAATVIHPHVLRGDTLRVRHGGHLDLRIPLDRITAVRREARWSHPPAEGALDVTVGGQTSIAVELAEPVTHVSLLGRRRPVGTVRFHADDADGLVAALRRA
ncbi:hypothetical protein [Streptomyces sp. bgisy154]|uniref:hypothetical protein n=1 Tax=Streptomyces sp. bgisy154 TaxID=3413794 RepID=UPI003D721015